MFWGDACLWVNKNINWNSVLKLPAIIAIGLKPIARGFR
jgi:hypothetical protein